MGMIVFLAAVLIEVVFVIWTFKTQRWHDREKELMRLAAVLLLLLLVVSGLLAGFVRYGMFIGVIILQVLSGMIAIGRKRERKFAKGKTAGVFIGTILLYFFSLIPAFVFPQCQLPKPTGSHEVETAEYTWMDESRVETYTDTGENRELTVKMFYPRDAGSYPLVAFSHGAFGVIDSNASTCEELASNGYVVVSIAHTYQAMFVKNTQGQIRLANQDFLNSVMENNGTDTPEGEKIVYENSKEWMAVRTADENFVLDTILAKAADKEEAPFDRINGDKIGLFGHSMGGATSVAVGRQRDDIDAVIDLEGTMFGEYVDFQDGREVYNEEPYTVPVLDVNSSDIDAEARALSKKGYEYVNFYLGERATDYHYEVIEGAGHLNFTDLPMVSPLLAHMLGTGDVDAKQCIENVNGMVLKFFDGYLK